MASFRPHTRAGRWPGLVEAHDRFVEDYNAQAHFAHRDRPDGPGDLQPRPLLRPARKVPGSRSGSRTAA